MPEFNVPIIVITGFTLVATIAWSDFAKSVMTNLHAGKRMDTPQEHLKYAISVSVLVYGTLYIIHTLLSGKDSCPIIIKCDKKHTDTTEQHDANDQG